MIKLINRYEYHYNCNIIVIFRHYTASGINAVY